MVQLRKEYIASAIRWQVYHHEKAHLSCFSFPDSISFHGW
jgi:hypothetical protein